jgi:pectin methylesterase-like acyl-CoA thioesterase
VPNVLRLLICAATLGVAGCSSDDAPSQGRILEVPASFATIQDAVDTARDGDLVLVAAGMYRESVVIDTDGITLRGTDRNDVVLDGVYEQIAPVSP